MSSELRVSPSDRTSMLPLQSHLNKAKTELIQRTRTASGGLTALGQYSDQIDGLICRIHKNTQQRTKTPHALVAVGGYGRRQMLLHSDVDILIVFDQSVGPSEETFLKSMLHPLWDLRLDVGHHVRELTNLKAVESENPEYLVALLDARFLEGNTQVFNKFSESCLAGNAAWRTGTREALRKLIKTRHSQFTNTLYHLEPDIKNVPGGLRDISATRMLKDLTDPRQPRTFEV